MRRKSLPVKVGNVTVGGEAPVSIQSMTNTDTSDIKATLKQINELFEAGCEIVRVAVTDESDAKSLSTIKKNSPLPVVADIQFDYRLALLCLEDGADKIRINPGNIGGNDKLARIIQKAKEKGIPLRIGVNSGSIRRELRMKYGGATADALVESALQTIKFLEENSFQDIVVSLKAANVVTTVDAYRKIAERMPYPLHLGVTEAGRGLKGAIKSSLGIGSLLLDGIGDTVRVSLTGDPVKEIYVAKEILQAAGSRNFGPDIISCPTCARCKIDLENLVDKVEEAVKHINWPLKIAVMGCPVNGPGEAREADIGISGGNNFGVIFKEGKVLKKVAPHKLFKALEKEIMEIVKQKISENTTRNGG
ncbi:MAG: flavodoxin-dependent (E)-4-hydroxy-3-methylbut-2-enyl-diphosphate synthase [Dethiobacter sp.]|nr:MAG: flavodoxin-dependent (E)-4-hydroxy-3-methylbut-2-enyl-diphosphate synthase [Dethiobacter sp.]